MWTYTYYWVLLQKCEGETTLLTSELSILWSALAIPFDVSPTCCGYKKGKMSNRLALLTASSIDNIGGSKSSVSYSTTARLAALSACLCVSATCKIYVLLQPMVMKLQLMDKYNWTYQESDAFAYINGKLLCEQWLGAKSSLHTHILSTCRNIFARNDCKNSFRYRVFL